MLRKEAENVNTYQPEVTLRMGPKVKMKIAFTDKEMYVKAFIIYVII